MTKSTIPIVARAIGALSYPDQVRIEKNPQLAKFLGEITEEDIQDCVKCNDLAYHPPVLTLQNKKKVWFEGEEPRIMALLMGHIFHELGYHFTNGGVFGIRDEDLSANTVFFNHTRG